MLSWSETHLGPETSTFTPPFQPLYTLPFVGREHELSSHMFPGKNKKNTGIGVVILPSSAFFLQLSIPWFPVTNKEDCNSFFFNCFLD